MTLEEAIEYFGTKYRMTKCLKLSFQNATHWQSRGYIPMIHQIRLEELTDGVLKADPIDPVLKRKLDKLRSNDSEETNDE